MIVPRPCLVAIYGQSGAGKDSVKDLFLQYPQVHPILQWTTRPMRENETQDKQYHFCSVEDFTEKLLSKEKGSMIEASQYNNWFYGTPYDNVIPYKINVGIFGLNSLKCLIDEQDEFYIYFLEIKAPDKIRLKRCLDREKDPDCDEVVRRFLSDKKDSKEIEACYLPEMHYHKVYWNGEYNPLRPESLISIFEDIKIHQSK